MNEKEIAEIRRRFRPDKTNLSRIRGCYVNSQGEIVSEFNQSLSLMSQLESEELLSILKKTLSGSLGKNLVDLEFSTKQVLESEEHKTLMALKNSGLDDDEAVSAFYKKVIGTVTFEGHYLILLSCDKYDVFSYSKDGSKSEDSTEMFTYILCSICPVKLTKPALSYFPPEKVFRNIAANSVIGSPELGFMFPSFDDRTSNIYNTLFYTRNTADSHDEFIDSVFKCEIPMPAAVQRETFQSVLCEALSEECNFEVVQAVNDKLNGMIEDHKASKEPEPLLISKGTIKSVLQSCEVDETHVAAFEEKYDSSFGSSSEILPQNILDLKQLEVRTPDVTIKVNPDRSDLIKTEIIDGTKYIMIRADDNVEVNGVNIHIS